jgi:hypothetical protein
MQAMHGKIKASGVNSQRYHETRWNVAHLPEIQSFQRLQVFGNDNEICGYAE